MKIRMLTGLSGPSINVSGGDEHDCSDAEAIRHVIAGHAVPVDKVAYEKAVKAQGTERR